MRWTGLFGLTTLALLVAASTGCSDDDGEVEVVRTLDGGAEPGADAADVEALDDAQIATVAAEANKGEVAQAMSALTRLNDTEARQFAGRMVEEHSAALAAGNELMAELGLEPTSSATSEALRQQSSELVDQLYTVDDDDLDAYYMDAQVTVHAQVLDLLRNQLIFQADSEALRALLAELESTVEDHLAMAEDVADDVDD